MARSWAVQSVKWKAVSRGKMKVVFSESLEWALQSKVLMKESTKVEMTVVVMADSLDANRAVVRAAKTDDEKAEW